MILSPELECMNRKDLRVLQFARLKNLIEKIYANVPFYKEKFDALGLKPSDIRCLEDIKKLPFTTKDDLRQTYPYGLLAVPQSEIVEIHMSSGTTGLPVVNAYTQADMDQWTEGMGRTLSGAGATRNDTVQNAYGYGLFTGGMGVHYGTQRIGATVIPISSGNTEKQLMLMRDFHSTLFTCTPSYALYMAEKAESMGINVHDLPVRAGCFGAEPWSENMRKEIEKAWNIKAYDIYGLTEITGPGVAFECEAQDGMHFNEDLWYPEIIDPETGEPLPDGEKGELVITTILKEGTPLIRYRTRDITYIMKEACSCGRTTRKIHRLFGRTDDLLILRGVNVFPSQIEHALIEIQGVQPNYLIVVDRSEKTHLDDVELHVEVSIDQFSDETRGMEALRSKIEAVMKSKLGISVKVKLVEPMSIERSIGKAKRVIDKRNLYNKD
ncbi:MAG TPA: phenylacetate--CoA ligase [Treponemataceae bacterium]|jgi:phenylacetate-CoA ligase|nr:phenylacetate--CoA ligase [Treponemataceae bacterium]HOQ93338.1 phenylacetate--CoA ligase [Treponemataceae bacterium]HPY53997.1 phenylacetate--CoA ligase [Treponemataceae bacterium]HQC27662.1 phenylacetate--CoA ligase [Treponemataceae bacterium]HUH45496.1 phenylacetate--CoA ligase [Treponemataceae bacterium]